MSLDVYMMGFYTFLPKYIEKHFLKTPALASIVAGGQRAGQGFVQGCDILPGDKTDNKNSTWRKQENVPCRKIEIHN